MPCAHSQSLLPIAAWVDKNIGIRAAPTSRLTELQFFFSYTQLASSMSRAESIGDSGECIKGKKDVCICSYRYLAARVHPCMRQTQICIDDFFKLLFGELWQLEKRITKRREREGEKK